MTNSRLAPVEAVGAFAPAVHDVIDLTVGDDGDDEDVKKINRRAQSAVVDLTLSSDDDVVDVTAAHALTRRQPKRRRQRGPRNSSVIVITDDDEDASASQNERPAKRRKPVRDVTGITDDEAVGEDHTHRTFDDEEDEDLESLNDWFTGGAESVKMALEDLNLADIGCKVVGMAVRLHAHQVIGVAWMRSLELKNAGGILADDMGLGKTVQTIGLICANRRPLEENWTKSTLIVAPTSVVGQWRDEIKKKTVAGALSVFVHHGTSKLVRRDDVAEYDIVITTYTTLNGEFGDMDGKRGVKAEEHIANAGRGKGPLAKTRWWRVVLDEAQQIRNHATVASINVATLVSRHRWCLTGTPVTNNLGDLYALIRFVRLKPWDKFANFEKSIGKIEKTNPSLAGRKAREILGPILLRRNKNSTLEGRPILELGPKTVTVHTLEFSQRERQIYDAIEKRQQDKLKQILGTGRLAKSYSFVLVMILRLRQAANHSQLISYAANEFAMNVQTVAAGGDREEVQRAKKVLGQQAFDEIRAKFAARADDADAEYVQDDALCERCMEPLTETARVTRCGHEFCAECVESMFEQAARAGDGSERKEKKAHACDTCGSRLDRETIFARAAFSSITDEEGRESVENAAKRGAKPGRQARLVNGVDIAALDKGKNFEPGTKMLKMLKLLKGYRRDAAGGRVEKTILYSQWTSMIDLVEILLEREGLKSIRYDGKMTRGARDDAIARFKSCAGADILIVSLKCGGVGLNLTEASRVISLDLAWNSATENQAFDRVHRMGQQRPVFVERLVVKDTIEDRIMKLQEKKQGLADAVLGEGVAQKQQKLTVRELKQLFGME